jgi:hypothetical protein
MVAMKEAIEKRKSQTKKLSLLNTPLRSLNAYLANKRATKKEAEDINKMIMKVDDMELDGLERKRKEELRSIMLRVKRKMAMDKRQVNGS